MNELSRICDTVSSAIVSPKNFIEAVGAKGYYTLKCIDADGKTKWEYGAPNLVVNVGLQYMNTQMFTGAAYTAAWYLGIYGAATSNNPAASDTMSSHAGWTENTSYSNATRQSAVFGVAATTANPSVISNSTAATFTINATTTVGGAFLVNNSTKGGTTGTLFSASDFISPGDRSAINGDSILVTYTFSLTAT
jgi:hypothetical protein